MKEMFMHCKKQLIIGKILYLYRCVIIGFSLLVILSCGEMGLTDSYIEKSVYDYTEDYINDFLTELDSFKIKEIHILENKPLEIGKRMKVPNQRDVLVEIKIQFYWNNTDLTSYVEMINKEVKLGILQQRQGLNYKNRLRKPRELIFTKTFGFHKEIKPGNKPEDWEMLGRYCKWEFLVKDFR